MKKLVKAILFTSRLIPLNGFGSRIYIPIVLVLALGSYALPLLAQSELSLENQYIKLNWEHSSNGYRLSNLDLTNEGKTIAMPNTFGKYLVLYSKEKPDTTVNPTVFASGQAALFDDYRYIKGTVRDNFRPVALNTAGQEISFYPSDAKKTKAGIEFLHENPQFVIKALWQLDSENPHDILIELRVKAKQSGYYSMASPTLYTVQEKELEWGILPGHFQGREIQPSLLLSYAYGQGIPNLPVISRERTASTLAPLLQNKAGITLAVIAEPETGRDPWVDQKNSHSDWRLGLSLMNRNKELTPTLYHPVLGEVDSYLNQDEERVFRFRYSVQKQDWFEVYKHAIYDVYHFDKSLDLKDTKESLSNRILSMLAYLRVDSTSLWQNEHYKGLAIGAQSYLGGVVGSDRDAMKNSDYGAMWMLANITGDRILKEKRLPTARNFKLTQQEEKEGFFQGSAAGQYYLSKSKRFTEEWGDYVEPIALTYYIMLDMGNVLLFNPNDKELLESLRIGADKLLEWQQPNGNWQVAYDKHSEEPVFKDQQDLRPTFYGLLVAYRLLGDDKYLEAAKLGADWYVENAVKKGHFLGVCGDVRFVPDFATAQSVQALLDLYDLTAQASYLEAAIEAARIYTASIYTHPMPTRKLKNVNGQMKRDWEISQVGLSFEHGGSLGSANLHGPILLSSHAGMFVRIFGLTGEKIFLDMARSAAWGRDAFVNPTTHIASYYWNQFDSGAGSFPHHAWWQIGWITDYLMSEIELRSEGKIKFPRGFITPKVGPHQTYAFASGSIFENTATLYLPEKAIAIGNPRIDFIGAKGITDNSTFIMLLNNSNSLQKTSVLINQSEMNLAEKYRNAVILDRNGKELKKIAIQDNKIHLDIPALGLYIIKLN